jgi:signal transduction histidine kinase
MFIETDHRRRPIDANKLALEALHIFRRELAEYAVRTNIELASGLPLVMGDKGQLQEVILNLVHNAIDAMASVEVSRRTLKLRTKNDGAKRIIIEVEDSGEGISPERLSGIFDAFVTTKSSGTGLGLAICSRIIEQHGGRLTADSDGKNGTIFQIILPTDYSAMGANRVE